MRKCLLFRRDTTTSAGLALQVQHWGAEDLWRSHPAGRGYGQATTRMPTADDSCASGPLAFWLLLVALAMMAVWTITTATYFAFREDVLTRLIARQTEMQYGYEDRISEMRVQVDRVSSRQLLDQDQYEEKLEQIFRRQSALESRANALGGLAVSMT